MEIFDRAFKLRVGEWSPVLKSPYGYHIYQVLEKKPSRQWTFKEAKDKIRSILIADREQAAYSSWLEEQIRLAVVKRSDELIDAVKVETLGEK